MYFQYLESFQKVAECRSMTKASDLLFLSVSALKQQMDSLETEVGAKLLNRSTKGVTLTPAGEYFYEKCAYLTAQWNDILWETRNIGQNSSTTVFVGFRHKKITDYIYPEFLMSFFQDYPNAHVALVDLDQNSYKNVDLLICDYAENPNFKNFYHLRDLPVYCIMNVAHPLADHRTLELEMLQKYHLIVPPLPILRYLEPELVKDLQKQKISVQESELAKEILYMNLLHSDNIILAFGDEKYLNSVLVQVPLGTYHVDYGIKTRGTIKKPLAQTFLDQMVEYYRSPRKNPD